MGHAWAEGVNPTSNVARAGDARTKCAYRMMSAKMTLNVQLVRCAWMVRVNRPGLGAEMIMNAVRMLIVSMANV